jgi:uncharacterized protein YqeY
MAVDPAKTLKERLRADLTQAMKARDAAHASVLRALLGALDNAEAPAQSAEQSSAVSRSFAEGAAEVGRLALSPQQLAALLENEAADREQAAAELERHGRGDRAAALRAEAALVRRYRA